MKTTSIAGCIGIGILGVVLAQSPSLSAEKKAVGSSTAMIKRGLYLVTLGGCDDCHSPKKMTPNGPVPDDARLLSGHPAGYKIPDIPQNIIGPDKWGGIFSNGLTAWVGPWGTSYAPNLSPDQETGIGAWNAELFIKILRTGKFMASGRDILPPMPWFNYAKLSDKDLKAIFAYMKSLKPIRNKVPDSIPAPPPQRQ
jgi:mono/diheme cytochrome c family protein